MGPATAPPSGKWWRNWISQHAKYTCSFCGKTKMKRWAVGIWHCGSCMKTVAAGAWTSHTTSVLTVKSTVRSLRDPKGGWKRYLLRWASSAINGLIYIKKKYLSFLPHRLLSVLFNKHGGKPSVRDRDRFTREPSGRLESDSCDSQRTEESMNQRSQSWLALG